MGEPFIFQQVSFFEVLGVLRNQGTIIMAEKNFRDSLEILYYHLLENYEIQKKIDLNIFSLTPEKTLDKTGNIVCQSTMVNYAW